VLLPSRYLEEIHLAALANVLRRPVLVLSAGFQGGLFLPLRHDPEVGQDDVDDDDDDDDDEDADDEDDAGGSGDGDDDDDDDDDDGRGGGEHKHMVVGV
jgi:hypothetical protein